MPSNGIEFFSIIVPIVTYDLLENIDEYNSVIETITRNPSANEELISTLRRLSESEDDEEAKTY